MKTLKILAFALKVYSFLVLLLMSVGLVGLMTARQALQAQGQQPIQMILNLLFSGTLAFLVLYSLAEIIRFLISRP